MSEEKEVAQLIDQVVEHLEKEEDITIKNLREKDPQGLGDTLERVFAKFGITEEVISKGLGLRGCGCQKRKQFLNQVFPYRKKK